MQDLPADARLLLERARVARLATVDEHSTPHLVPICFASIEDRLYSVIDEKPKRDPARLKRLRNIAANPRVAVLVDRYEEDWQSLAFLMLKGSASVVSRSAEYRSALARLRAKYSQYESMNLVMSSNAMIRVDVDAGHFWSASGDRSR